MAKRMTIICCVMLFALNLLIVRLYVLATGEELAQAADQQSSYVLDVAEKRGMIYDCNLKPLVNEETEYVAAVSPSTESANALMEVVDPADREALLERFQAARPFRMLVEDNRIYASGIRVFNIYKRYAEDQIAPHIIGYTDQTGGVAGIEKAYDSFLTEHSGQLKVRYSVDATGQSIGAMKSEVEGEGYDVKQGVVLTIDRDIQRLCEHVMASSVEKGACVVMDVDTGKLRAVVSLPDFQPDQVAELLEDEDAPLLNRAFSAYNVGSTFKLAVAAAALDAGVSPDFSYYCTGSITLNGVTFHCHNHNGHGVLDLQGAIELSCNPYFVNLALEIDYPMIYNTASNIGFGKGTELAPGITTAAGVLPEPSKVKTIGELANLAFGQGQLLATPVQIAQLISTVANGGNSVTPSLVEGTTNEEGTQIAEYAKMYGSSRVMSKTAADRIAQYMRDAVEEGSGTRAQPIELGAGGKTGSAQTGQYDENGEEIVHAWFAGFYPANQPKYAIVVFSEGGDSGALESAPLFSEIANGLYSLGKI